MPKSAKLGLWLLAAITIFTCLFRLGAIPVQLWDEARQAINLLEMRNSGQWLYTTFRHEPDFYNTKPLLLIWLQAVTSLFTGMNEWALRIPSAAATIVCCLLLFRLMRRYAGTNAAALSVLALLSSQGFIAIHVARTGDYDALLGCCLLGSMAGYFHWSETGSEKSLYAGTICTLLAIFTKSTAGFLFLPGIGIYLLSRKKLFSLITHKKNLVLATSGSALIIAWYIYRESAQPGYLNAVFENELGGRFLRQSETHGGTWWFYLRHIYREGFLLLIPACIGYWLSYRKNPLALMGLVVTLTFLILISISATKITWYAAPAYPLLAIGYGLLADYMIQRLPRHSQIITGIMALPALLIWVGTILWPIYRLPMLHEPGPEDELCIYMRKGRDSIGRGFHIVTGEYYPQVIWYNAALERRGSLPFRTVPADAVKQGDSILVWHENLLKPIREQFDCQTIKQERHLHFMVVGEARGQIPNFVPAND
jgi:4-amino-4-deoxy-L-arabinose transferase-like glycosyltransferase